MIGPGRVAVLISALALAASGCEAGGAAESGAPLQDLTVATAATDATVDYVALGDSFSAGPFIGTMRTDPSGCARSRDNYPAFLADWLGVRTYTDVTCSAAVTADLYSPMTMLDGKTTGPQLDALTPDTDLVTLGIGGNDYGIYSALIQCQEGAAALCPVDTLRSDAGKVAGRIAQAVRRIEKVAPDAAVYVVGYPDILPTSGTCKAVGVSADVLGPVTEIAAMLNASLKKGAATTGASYIDMQSVSTGHDVCAKGKAWVNGPRFRAGIAAPFHPKINGMRAVATELYTTITGEQPDVTEYADPDPGAVVLNKD